jgi:hypothetical protein
MTNTARNAANKAAVEALLRARKLDRTLTTAQPAEVPVAPFGLDALDQCLRGGLPRGQVSEVTGPVSSGRTGVAWAALAAATRRGEIVSLVDTLDRFDPETAAAAGLDLARLLWVRGQAISKTAAAVDPAWLPGVRAVTGPGTLLERTIDRALKALNLVVQSGVCTLVAIDLVDVPAAALARIPASTWLRFHRIVEGTETALLIVAATPISRSPGGMSIQTGAGNREPGAGPISGSPVPGSIAWRGDHDRSRRLGGVAASLRASSPRWTAQGSCSLHFTHVSQA